MTLHTLRTLLEIFSLFAFTAGWSQAKMMCWTSCVTLQWGHRSVWDFLSLYLLQLLSLEQLESVLSLVKMDLILGEFICER